MYFDQVIDLQLPSTPLHRSLRSFNVLLDAMDELAGSETPRTESIIHDLQDLDELLLFPHR